MNPARTRYRTGESWRSGAVLDVGSWLVPVNGKTPAVIVSAAHLVDEERALVLGVLFEELLAWTARSPAASVFGRSASSTRCMASPRIRRSHEVPSLRHGARCALSELLASRRRALTGGSGLPTQPQPVCAHCWVPDVEAIKIWLVPKIDDGRNQEERCAALRDHEEVGLLTEYVASVASLMAR